MSGSMKRFAVVAILLLLLVVYYSTRLSPEQPPEPEAATEAPAEPIAGQREAPIAPVVQGDEEQRDWFPDLSDRNDVPGVNLGATVERTTFDCDIEALVEDIGLEGLDDDDDPRLEEILESLAVSGDAELQLAAAQLGFAAIDSEETEMTPEEASELLVRAYRTDPTNPLVLWNVMQACDRASAPAVCDDPALEVDFTNVLSGNGEYWVRVAERRYAQQDHPGALYALRQAAAAPEFDNYFMLNVRMQQRALSLIPDTGYTAQALGAYGLATMQVESGPGPCLMGDERSDPEWLDACMSVARRYESEGRTIQQRRLGAGLQVQLYRTTGQNDAADAATERLRGINQQRLFTDQDLIAVMLTDERMLSLFLDEFEAGDEFSAIQFFRDEVERLMQDPNYHPCPPADEPVITD